MPKTLAEVALFLKLLQEEGVQACKWGDFEVSFAFPADAYIPEGNVEPLEEDMSDEDILFYSSGGTD